MKSLTRGQESEFCWPFTAINKRSRSVEGAIYSVLGDLEVESEELKKKKKKAKKNKERQWQRWRIPDSLSGPSPLSTNSLPSPHAQRPRTAQGKSPQAPDIRTDREGPAGLGDIRERGQHAPPTTDGQPARLPPTSASTPTRPPVRTAPVLCFHRQGKLSVTFPPPPSLSFTHLLSLGKINFEADFLCRGKI